MEHGRQVKSIQLAAIALSIRRRIANQQSDLIYVLKRVLRKRHVLFRRCIRNRNAEDLTDPCDEVRGKEQLRADRALLLDWGGQFSTSSAQIKSTLRRTRFRFAFWQSSQTPLMIKRCPATLKWFSAPSWSRNWINSWLWNSISLLQSLQ